MTVATDWLRVSEMFFTWLDKHPPLETVRADVLSKVLSNLAPMRRDREASILVEVPEVLQDFVRIYEPTIDLQLELS